MSNLRTSTHAQSNNEIIYFVFFQVQDALSQNLASLARAPPGRGQKYLGPGERHRWQVRIRPIQDIHKESKDGNRAYYDVTFQLLWRDIPVRLICEISIWIDFQATVLSQRVWCLRYLFHY